jgi:hypothetical protein
MHHSHLQCVFVWIISAATVVGFTVLEHESWPGTAHVTAASPGNSPDRGRFRLIGGRAVIVLGLLDLMWLVEAGLLLSR